MTPRRSPAPATLPWALRHEDIEFAPIRAGGPGGQNVNKVSSAVHLRFDIRAASLPNVIKSRLLARRDRRITAEGVIVIKSQRHRTAENNRAEAVARLVELIAAAAVVPRFRKATKPTQAAEKRRLENKAKRGALKAQRRKVLE